MNFSSSILRICLPLVFVISAYADVDFRIEEVTSLPETTISAGLFISGSGNVSSCKIELSFPYLDLRFEKPSFGLGVIQESDISTQRAVRDRPGEVAYSCGLNSCRPPEHDAEGAKEPQEADQT